MTPIRTRLLRLAGYTDPDHHAEPVNEACRVIHQEFLDIASALEEIALRKVNGYGPFRYENLSTWRWEAQALYQDVERKFERLRTSMKPNPVGPEDADALIECLGDLAVYAERGIQLILRLEEAARYATAMRQRDMAERIVTGWNAQGGVPVADGGVLDLETMQQNERRNS